MKKQLIVLAGITAMFAACTNEDVLENFEAKEALKAEGITFSIAAVESRGDFKMDDATSKFVANWNAEVDRINVAHYGVIKGSNAYVNGWNNEVVANRSANVPSTVLDDNNTINSAVYKATKTANKGEFTAASDADVLNFTTTTNADGYVIGRIASFRAYRGGETGKLEYSTNNKKLETMSLEVEVPIQQTQETATKAPFDNFVMVSDTIGNVHSSTLAVGESLPLSFERAFAGLVFNTTGYNKNVYGKLVSITVKMDDSNIAGEGHLDIAKKVNGVWKYTPNTVAKTVKLNLGSAGLEWNDNYYAFMQILPVDRSSYRVSELYDIEVEFENGTIIVEKTSSKNWVANNFYTINLDLNNTADYLLNNNKLIVIKSLPTVGSGKDLTAAEAAAITEVQANVALTAAELAVLKSKFTSVTTMTLANEAADLGVNLANVSAGNITTLKLTAATTAPIITSYAALTTLNCPAVTTIPAEAYKGNNGITKYNFPKVVTIGANAFEDNTQITVIGCNTSADLIIGTTNSNTGVKTSYLTTIGDNALKGATNIVTIDAPAMTTFGTTPFGTGTANMQIKNVLLPSYDWTGDTMATLQLLVNNSALETVDLSGTTKIAGVTSLAGKENLKKVIIAPNTELGGSAFAGAGVSATTFTIVNVNKVSAVGDNAFANSAISGDIKFVNEVATIGKGAFEGTAITSFDFTNVTAIGESAFKNATALKMVTVPSVETIEKNTFNGCSGVIALQLDATTTIKHGALVGLDSNANIVLKEAVTIEGNPFNATPLITSGTNYKTAATAYNIGTLGYTLYVNSAQEGVHVANKTLTWKSGDYYYKATFANIVK